MIWIQPGAQETLTWCIINWKVSQLNIKPDWSSRGQCLIICYWMDGQIWLICFLHRDKKWSHLRIYFRVILSAIFCLKTNTPERFLRENAYDIIKYKFINEKCLNFDTNNLKYKYWRIKCSAWRSITDINTDKDTRYKIQDIRYQVLDTRY